MISLISANGRLKVTEDRSETFKGYKIHSLYNLSVGDSLFLISYFELFYRLVFYELFYEVSQSCKLDFQT